MGFLNIFKRTDINAGVELYRQTKDAVLLDVRGSDEYKEGHIPDSMNLDVKRMKDAPLMVKEKQTPLFVYCYSGARSSQAVSALKSMGYTNVTNIGGIAGYHGRIER